MLSQPLRDYEPNLQKIARQYQCDIVCKSLGGVEERREIYLDHLVFTRSSLHERKKPTLIGAAMKERDIELATMDSFLVSHPGLERLSCC